MRARRLRLGFLVAAAFALLALVLPLSSETVLALSARPALLALTLAAALLFALAAWASKVYGAAICWAPVCGAVITLALLRDPAILGSATIGFWAMVIAVWLAAALCVMQLATLRPRDASARRLLNLAIPLLFGAVVFYLWEVGVRGFGVPPVLLPPPSAAAARFARSLPTLMQDFVQTFIRGVLIGYVIGCGAGLLVAIVANRYSFRRVAACFRSAISSPRCRWSASRRSW